MLCVFESLFGGLGTTYDVHLRLIGKRVADFLLVLIKLFFAKCYGWDAMSEHRLKISNFAPTRSLWPKILDRRGLPHQPSFFSENEAKWTFVWYRNLDWFFFRFCHNSRVWQTARQTDGRTDRILIPRPRLHSMQSGKIWSARMCCIFAMRENKSASEDCAKV